MNENTITVDDMSKALDLLRPMIKRFNQEHNPQNEANQIEVAKILPNRLRMFSKLCAGCVTFGDLRRKLLTRYESFTKTITNLSTEEPSIERFEKICSALCEAMRLARCHQDISISNIPELTEALELLAERPKTPKTDIISDRDFRFSNDEVTRILTALKAVFETSDAMVKDSRIIALDLDLPLPEWLQEVAKLPQNERARATLFEPHADGTFRYRSDIFEFIIPFFRMEAMLFKGLSTPGAEEMPISIITSLLSDEAGRGLLVATLPMMKDAFKAQTPELLDIRGDQFVDKLINSENLPQLRSIWNSLCENEHKARQLKQEILSLPSLQGKVAELSAENLHHLNELLAKIESNKQTLKERFRRAGTEPPEEAEVIAITSPLDDANTVKKVEHPTFVLGPWAARFVTSVDVEARQIRLKGKRNPLNCPPKSVKPWDYLTRMLTSSDPEGWIELDDYEASSWYQSFSRSGKAAKTTEAKALKAFLPYIKSKNQRGQHGKSCIRLAPKR